jgi:hypothetical protein
MSSSPARPQIAFFDFPDVFEDFYPHYGVTQQDFASRWSDTGNHAFAAALQRYVGDVIWYAFSLKPELSEASHAIGYRVRMLPSGSLHRGLWWLYYMPRCAWRWRRLFGRRTYGAYATPASYLSLCSWPFFTALRRDRPDFFFVQDYASGRFDVLRWVSRALRRPLIAYTRWLSQAKRKRNCSRPGIAYPPKDYVLSSRPLIPANSP